VGERASAGPVYSGLRVTAHGPVTVITGDFG
jgi:hypothetical protein